MTKIHWFTFALISIAFIINPQSSPASTTADVEYDGKRISVHASGVPLKQLLSMVVKQTGIQFSYDDLLAETNVYAVFDNNTLADGVRRILLQFNYAVIYTGSGHIKSVLVLNRQRASSKSPGNQTKLHAPQHETDINDISAIFPDQEETPPNNIVGTLPDQEEAPPNNLIGTLPDQEETTSFSEQIPDQVTSGQDMPPGAEQLGVDESVTPPPGAETLSPVVDPDVSAPLGAEPLSPVVDPNISPPPGEDPFEPDNVDTFSSDTEKQAASPAAN